MPTIFQAQCRRCSYRSDIFPAAYGAVLVDEPAAERCNHVVAGAVLMAPASDAPIAQQHDPRLVVLAHPIEQTILAGTGYTWAGLAWTGRYVRIRRAVCQSCGTIFEVSFKPWMSYRMRHRTGSRHHGGRPGGYLLGVHDLVWGDLWLLGDRDVDWLCLHTLALPGSGTRAYRCQILPALRRYKLRRVRESPPVPLSTVRRARNAGRDCRHVVDRGCHVGARVSPPQFHRQAQALCPDIGGAERADGVRRAAQKAAAAKQDALR